MFSGDKKITGWEMVRELCEGNPGEDMEWNKRKRYGRRKKGGNKIEEKCNWIFQGEYERKKSKENAEGRKVKI